jgi:hypothetical protein
MAEVTEAMFTELAKWERHSLGHSPGYLNLSSDRLWFVPHAISILSKGFDIPLSSVAKVERSDNWLWRGAVNIYLHSELRLDMEFRVDPETLVSGMEQPVFWSDRLRLFLGFKRKQFFKSAQGIGLEIGN